MEVFLRNDRDAGLFQLLLAERAIVFELIGVRGSPDYQLARLPQLVRLGTLAQHVVEHDDVGPGHLAHPVVGLGHEAVADLLLLLRLDEELRLVAFFDNLPGDVRDQPVERDEEEFLLVQCQLQRSVNCAKGMKKRGTNKSVARRPFDSQ